MPLDVKTKHAREILTATVGGYNLRFYGRPNVGSRMPQGDVVFFSFEGGGAYVVGDPMPHGLSGEVTRIGEIHRTRLGGVVRIYTA